MKKIVTSRWMVLPFGAIILSLVAFTNYKLSYQGETEEICFQSDNIDIKGIIVKPKSPGPHPAIVLLHGSGGNHQGHDKWYNRLHTNQLVKKGFAVLSYTKRGSGDNNVDYSYVGFEELMNDAIKAIDFLESKPYVDPNLIGIMGISESGWFAPEVAAKSGKVKFIINRVSPSVSVMETVLHEVTLDAKKDGFSDQEIKETIIPLLTRIWNFYINAYENESIAISKERVDINTILNKLKKDERFADWFPKKLKEYDNKWYKVRAFKYSYSPEPYIKQSNIPMLYILAKDDVNVPTQKCIIALERLRNDFNKNITVKVFPDTGHYLYRWEFLPVEGLYVPGYLDLVGEWAANQVINNKYN